MKLIYIIIINLIIGTLFCQSNRIKYNSSKNINLSNHITALAKLSLSGENWENNIQAKFTIIYNNKEIYSFKSSELFPNINYFDLKYYKDNFKCNNYIECKKGYLLNLLNHIICSSKKRRYINESDSSTVSIIKININKKSGLKGSELNKETDRFINYLLKEDYDQLFIPYGPFKNSDILVYNLYLQKFISIDLE
jgi:hypothetical protein